MSTFLGLPCDPPATFESVFFPLSETFSRKLFFNPNYSEMGQFWNSRFFMLFFLWYVVFRIPREYSRMISVGLGVSMGLVALINVIVVFEVFRRHGYECTVFLCLLLYLVYFFLLSMIPVAARTPAIAEVFPEIKELPVAQKEPGLNHCRRLAICRYSPVFDNHQFQKGKYQRCIECAKQSKGFQYDGSNKECQSGVTSNDPKKCYKCIDSEVDVDDCTLTKEECASVTLVLDMIDPPKTEIATSDDLGRQRIRSRSTGTKYNRQEACRIGQGSLCWFREAAPGTGKYFGWQGIGEHGSARPVFEDLTQPGVIGKGYPTQAICEAKEGAETTCIEATGRGCKKDEEMLARCACEQYTDTPKFSNPCEFLERNCDINSIAYTEAEMKMKQAEIDVSDIVSVEDVRGFIGKLDDVSRRIP